MVAGAVEEKFFVYKYKEEEMPEMFAKHSICYLLFLSSYNLFVFLFVCFKNVIMIKNLINGVKVSDVEKCYN